MEVKWIETLTYFHSVGIQIGFAHSDYLECHRMATLHFDSLLCLGVCIDKALLFYNPFQLLLFKVKGSSVPVIKLES